MSAGDYVITYLNVQIPLADGSVVNTRIRNYLQSGLGNQSVRAQAAQQELFQAINKELKRPSGSTLPESFEAGGYSFLREALRRVYMGKAAPNEIQDTIWLASYFGLVNDSTLPSYCDNNLGIDCGGFVANYWGMGRPSTGTPRPVGWDGFKPRTIWNMNSGLRRKIPSQIKVDDAVIFFKNVKNNNPDDLKTNANPKGSEAFHIGLLSYMTEPSPAGKVDLWIAESSGASRADGANGVHERDGVTVTLQTARGLVYFEESAGGNRCYFVGPASAVSPYPMDNYGG